MDIRQLQPGETIETEHGTIRRVAFAPGTGDSPALQFEARSPSGTTVRLDRDLAEAWVRAPWSLDLPAVREVAAPARVMRRRSSSSFAAVRLEGRR